MFLHIGDARTFFHTQNLSYDLIVSVPSNPWVSGVSSLFSLEFYSHIKRYLKPGGQLVQWLQLYEFNNELMLHIMRALDESFKFVSVYRAPEEPDVVIVASDEPVFQKHIDRFRTDSTLQKEFSVMNRPWYFFGEQNFLFKMSGIKPVLKMVEANSEYTPLVDNKAEKARFVNSYVGFMTAFDSCQVCWSSVLDSADYAPRRAFLDSLAPHLPRNKYLEDHLLLSLKNRDEDFDWARFWTDYREWSAKAPFSPARDSIPLYQELRSIELPTPIAVETEFMDLLMHKKYKEAAELIPLLKDNFDLEESDEFLLRHIFIAGMLGGEKDYMRSLFLDLYLKNLYFDRAEKYLMKSVAGVPDRIKKVVLQDREEVEN
jgi:SAM-dependent methyltransferase